MKNGEVLRNVLHSFQTEGTWWTRKTGKKGINNLPETDPTKLFFEPIDGNSMVDLFGHAAVPEFGEKAVAERDYFLIGIILGYQFVYTNKV